MIDRTRLPIPDEVQSHETVEDIRDLAEPFEQLQPVAAPPGAPNVLIILIDDMGFAAPSAFGGPCRMPTAERLAGGGLRYTRFHTAALCAPTRAALLSGRNHHSAAMGGIPETATSAPGYTSVRPRSVTQLPRILRDNGYATGAFGKMHGTPAWEMSPTGPFDRWPTGDGFDRFYGFIGAESDHFNPPDLVDNITRVDPPKTEEEGYHLSEDLVEKAIEWIDSLQTVEPTKPWFCYLSYGATHAPLHVPEEWRDKYRGEFSHGWNVERERILERQKALGIVPKETELSPWPDEALRWEDCTPTQRRVAERLMELYAAFAEHTDAQTGRVIDYLERSGQLDNTVVVYILGDNGPSAEGGIDGTWNENLAVNGIPGDAADIETRLTELGGPHSYCQYPAGWALAMSTPYPWTKQVASHYGGTRDGMIVHWPNGITQAGGLRNQWHHVVDVVPTILEVAHLPAPTMVDGIKQKDMEGVSFAYSLNEAEAGERHLTQYFEALGNRGIYHEGWTAAAKHRTPWRLGMPVLPRFDEDPWELYDTNVDWGQARNVADKYPERLAELKELFLREARKHDVFPLDDRLSERFNPALAGRQDLMGSRKFMLLRRTTPRLRENVAPNVKSISHSVTARIVLEHERESGVLIAQGGRFGGWAVYLLDGYLFYRYNFCGIEFSTAQSSRRIGAGERTLRMQFQFDGGWAGAGATVTLSEGSEELGRCRMDRTIAFMFSQDETLDIGVDRGTPVAEEYGHAPGNSFTGRLDWVRITLEGAPSDPDEEETLAAASIVH